MSPMEQALDALGRGQGAWTKDTAQILADLIAAKDARIERLQAAAQRACDEYFSKSQIASRRIENAMRELRAALAGEEE